LAAVAPGFQPGGRQDAASYGRQDACHYGVVRCWMFDVHSHALWRRTARHEGLTGKWPRSSRARSPLRAAATVSSSTTARNGVCALPGLKMRTSSDGAKRLEHASLPAQGLILRQAA